MKETAPMYATSSIQRLPLECLRDICDLLPWNDFYSLAKTSRTNWSSLNSFRFMQCNKPFVITDDKMARLTRSYTGSQRTFEKCIFAKTCTHLLFPADTAIKNGIMYLLLRIFRNVTLLDISSAKTGERERRALLQMVNKRFSGFIIKVSQNAYLEWSSLAIELQCLSLMIVADNMQKMHNASEPEEEEGAYDDLPMDNFCTPAHVEKQVASFRDFLKRQLLSKGLLSLNSECTTNSTSPSFQLPQFLFQFGFQTSRYTKMAPTIKPSHVLPTNILHNQKHMLKTIVGEVGAMFVESIIATDTLWIMVTQVDVFITNSTLDDCSYNADIVDLSQITFDIVKKQESSVRWKEIIIQYGPFQLLVMGGIWGSLNDKSGKPFLGCSVPFSESKNQHDGFVCYLPSRPASYHQTYRYLRDYSKSDSRFQFAFISQRFKAAGLSAVHPLFFKEHTKTATASNATLSLLGSHILASYVSGETRREEIEEYIQMLVRNKAVERLVKKDENAVLTTTMAEFWNLHSTAINSADGLAKVIIQKLCIMEKATLVKSPVNMNLVDGENESRLLDIMKKGLSSAVAKANKSRVRCFKEKFC